MKSLEFHVEKLNRPLAEGNELLWYWESRVLEL